MINRIVIATVLVGLTACSGLRVTEEAYSAHAENFNILFLQIPGGDTQKRAMALVPERSEVKTISTSPIDTTSFFGVLNRILGIDVTFINGTIKKE